MQRLDLQSKFHMILELDLAGYSYYQSKYVMWPSIDQNGVPFMNFRKMLLDAKIINDDSDENKMYSQ
jgi:hypothetical protein